VTKEPQEIIIEYPEAFPITEPLREVFTERLRTFFTACNTWSCSNDGQRDGRGHHEAASQTGRTSFRSPD
jgi:hypothetical protein